MDALRGRTEGFLPVDHLPGVRSLARGSLILAVVLLATLADGCQRGAGQSAAVDGHKDGKAAPHFVMPADTPYVTIFVTTLGNIEVNGKPADLQAVAGAFTGLAKQGGVVLYSRESPDREPETWTWCRLSTTCTTPRPTTAIWSRSIKPAIIETPPVASTGRHATDTEGKLRAQCRYSRR